MARTRKNPSPNASEPEPKVKAKVEAKKTGQKVNDINLENMQNKNKPKSVKSSINKLAGKRVTPENNIREKSVMKKRKAEEPINVQKDKNVEDNKNNAQNNSKPPQQHEVYLQYFSFFLTYLL